MSSPIWWSKITKKRKSSIKLLKHKNCLILDSIAKVPLPPFNLRVRKNGAEVWWPISPYKFWSEDLLQCIYENYGKKWATLFKSHLSSCSCSDFIKLCFKAVKIDFRQLQPTKTNSNKSLFSNFKHQDCEKRYDDLICLKRAWFKLSDEWSFAILAQIL